MTRGHGSSWGLAGVVGALFACAGCFGDDDDAGKSSEPGPQAGSTDEAGSGSNPIDLTGVNAGSGTAGTIAGVGGAAGTSGASVAPPPDCVAQTQVAEQVPVDMYIMLDRSGSMMGETGAGPTKWDAIRTALESFVQDPQSDGLGVGLQFFPLKSAGVPDTCLTDDDCGMVGGPCLNLACIPPPTVSDFTFIGCLTRADCPIDALGCMPLGQCSADPTYACFGVGPGGCDTMGDCDGLEGLCLLYASCDADDYMAPAVSIDVLPGNAMAVVDALMSQSPAGATPTSAALVGAINRAATHQLANPTHRTITVLATDGLPTDCLPTDIADVADLAAQGTALANPISTYVIGVFASTDPEAPANLNEIARAGGTQRAFLVDPDEDVAQQFLDALATIRGGALSCEFQLPDPPEGASLDFGRVNVSFTQDGDTSDLFYVEDVAGCSQAAGLGWHYDTNPMGSDSPTKIVVCPDTCDALTAATGESRVDVALGCESIRPQ